MSYLVSASPQVARGKRALCRLLRGAIEPRELSAGAFREWLAAQLPFWRRDPAFVQRERIRDLRRSSPRLHELERACRRAAAADKASSQSARLNHLEEQLGRTGKALAGLGAALAQAEPEKRTALKQKLADFQTRQQSLQEEQRRLTLSSPARQELLRVRAELQQLRERIGLETEEARLAGLLAEQGRRSGRSGESFEEAAVKLTWRHLAPAVTSSQDTRRLRVLRGVTLGAARTELDQLVIRKPRRSGQPVEVLALVEVKRNVNDVAHGFRQRQENLAWLTGDTAHYEAREYRTHVFRSGHFDREATHVQDGEQYVLARESFRHFRRDPDSGVYLRRLCFITRAGSLTGVSAAALARLRHRVSTDERWQPQGDAYLRELLRWFQSLTEPPETPDVLRLYCAAPGLGLQFVVVSR